MRSLDFMIIGVQKGGTTALSHFLSCHPQVAMASNKEVHLFDAPDYRPGLSQVEINQRYQHYFPRQAEGQLLGEATPIYLYWPEIIPELHRYNPRLKLIVLLRDPVQRAISQYQMERARGYERLPLLLALLLEPLRLWVSAKRPLTSAHRRHSYADRGCYMRQLRQLRRYFPDHQLLLLDNTELAAQHQETLLRVTQFLGLTPMAVAQEEIFSGGYVPQKNILATWLLRLKFKFANRGLRALLAAMGYNPSWPWLE